MTYEGCDGDAVGGSTVKVLVMCDTGQVSDSVDEGWLLWSTVHSIGICDLNGPVEPMIAVDRLGSFGGLLGIWGREGFGLRRWVIRLVGYVKRDGTFFM